MTPAARAVPVLTLVLLGSSGWTPLGRSFADRPPRPGTRAARPPAVGHLERPGLAPAPPQPRRTAPPATVRWGRYASVQVNVDALGQNILGDAANEPCIAVDPTNPARMVIGWRQFDSVTSDFRQAGWAYSQDAGRSWTFPGVLEPNVFRSDPVLGTDAEGDFYFYSLQDDFTCDLFRSFDGGQTWPQKRAAFGGDKQWFVIDQSAGPSHGFIYCAWSTSYSGWYWDTPFTRSTDGGLTFDGPFAPQISPVWGTLAVDPNGTLFIAGLRSAAGAQFWVTRSPDAQYAGVSPTFSSVQVDLGGTVAFNAPPNPVGLAGQVTIAADHSDGPTRGYLYVLCALWPAQPYHPMDVHIIRSTDGGETWSAPVRINDDPPGGGWHWFGTLSVAPTGRVDAAWIDTRGTEDFRLGAVYYSCSHDGGLTWSANEPLTPVFDSWVGWPVQQKMGDYYWMVSDAAGANLAYAATFNGEQDVYYLRIGPYDCNGNSVPDELDVAGGTSLDCNANLVPDECEPGSAADCNGNGVTDLCDIAGGMPDCNGNSAPDECDLAGGASGDCNANAVPDECETGGTGDCNLNGTPDLCDIHAGVSADCTGNGVPDECESDCNGNGVADSCDVAAGAPDCDANGRPDECDLGDFHVGFMLAADPGWSRQGEWAFGQPAGQGGDLWGNPDPASGYTGPNVFGVNLYGDYSLAPGGPWYLTAGPFPVWGLDAATLKFQRWLNCDYGPWYSDATVEASADGLNWTIVWRNLYQEIADPYWTAVSHDLSAVAEGATQLWIRWGYTVGEYAWAYTGWNIDDIEIIGAGHPDCNDNGRLDRCDLAAGTSADCNANRVPDECDVAHGTSTDCNANAAPDECDLAGGTSLDCDGNSLPDECDLAGGAPDCNANAVPDACDLAAGTSADCNANTVPDECELAAGLLPDCNANDVPDECDIAAGASTDCDANNVPDECDVAGGAAADCNDNGVPDSCDVQSQPLLAQSPPLSPLGGVPQEYTVPGARPAVSDVTLAFEALGDLNFAGEYVTVGLNGATLGNVYTGNPLDCVAGQTDVLVVTAATWNAALGGSGAVLTMAPSASVNPTQCGDASYIRVAVSYTCVPVSADADGNGVPDECRACSGDADCDGDVDAEDVDYFVAAIPDNAAAWSALYAARHGGAAPPCSLSNCDIDDDGHVGFADIDGFVARIGAACP